MHYKKCDLLWQTRIITEVYFFVVQAPAAEEEDILQPHYNLLTPTEIEAFKMIEIVQVQNKYLTRENILLQEHIIALKGSIRKLEHLLRSMLDDKPTDNPQV